MRESRNDCPFCSLPVERVIAGNTHALAVADAFPVSVGHTLIIPRRHVISFFELTEEEILAVHELLWRMKAHIESTRKPDGYNIGVNVGSAAGQTIAHVHAHLIPRYTDDIADPTGGVRNVIPGKGRYALEALNDPPE